MHGSPWDENKRIKFFEIIYNKKRGENFMKINNSYKDDIKIDRNNLEEEWVNQPKKFIEWAEKEIDAQWERDRAKEKLDLVRAELDSAIRKNPKLYGITAEKITEAAISNAIIQEKKFKEASETYLEKVREAKIMGVAREGFDQRKKALEKLTDLFLSQYWAEPRQGKVTKVVRDEQDKQNHMDTLEKSMIKRRNKE